MSVSYFEPGMKSRLLSSDVIKRVWILCPMM